MEAGAAWDDLIVNTGRFQCPSATRLSYFCGKRKVSRNILRSHYEKHLLIVLALIIDEKT